MLELAAWLNDQPVSAVPYNRRPTRKFVAEVSLSKEGKTYRRLCSHYLPFAGKSIGKDYYFGDDYSDYPLHTNVAYALKLVRQYCLEGRLLDVGCALGIYTKSFLDAGFDAYGIDGSEYAVAEAARLVGEEHIHQCNFDLDSIPFELKFDVFWMWDVLEHTVDPKSLLLKVTHQASPTAHLFLHTSNSQSLTSRLLGADWEGFTDYSHYGIEKVCTTSLRKWLEELGWEIVEWECGQVWVEGMDPILLRLREAFHRIPELNTFLSERELGDAILVVAVKR